MKPPPLALLALGVALMVLFPVILLATLPSAPSGIPPCDRVPSTLNLVSVPAGQTILLEETYFPGARLTVWSNSTSLYSLYLLNNTQWDAFLANGTGPNGTLHYTPPSSYEWTSGLVHSTNDTFLVSIWWLLADNPGTSVAVVNVIAVACGPPP